VDVAGEDAGLQAELAVVDLSSASPPVGEADRLASGPKASSRLSVAVAGTFRAASPPASRPRSLPPHSSVAPRHRLVDPALSRLASFSEIIGPMKVSRSLGSPATSVLRLATSMSRKVVVDIVVDDDALHPDAALARLVEGAEHDPLDAWSRSASLSTITAALPPSSSTTFFLPALAFRSQPTPGEPVKDSSFSRSSVVNRSAPVAAGGQDREGAFGRSVSASTSPMMIAPSGVMAGRLHHEGAAHGDGRRDLVRGQVEREVERRDEAARPDRHPLPHAHVALGPRRDVERLDLAVIAHASSAAMRKVSISRVTSPSHRGSACPPRCTAHRPVRRTAP
jgi:hypothetical protein